MLRWGRRWGVVLVGVMAAAVCARAQADVPANTLLSAPLVSPQAAWGFYGAATAHTVSAGASAPDELKALARGLGGGREANATYTQNVFEYVRRNIEIEFRFGLSKGGFGAALEQSGTAFDQAELMVKLLRQGGVAASYQVGTITLDAQQFGRWSGLVKDYDVASQGFAVDARAACQFLANGGVPASVNGASDCGSLSGNLSTVTLAHIWVNSGGILYDPSFKIHKIKPGVDLPSAMGCGSAVASTCGSVLSAAALNGASMGAVGGAATLQGVSESGVAAQLQTLAVNLQRSAEASMPDGELEDLVGGAKLEADAVASAGMPYPSVVQFEWGGDIPDQYRTKLGVNYSELSVSGLYADDLAGRVVRVFIDHPVPGDAGYTRKLFADDVLLAEVGCPSCAALSDAMFTIAIDHPYAALGGSYGDEAVITPLTSRNDSITLVAGYGDTGAYLAQFVAMKRNAVFYCKQFSPLCQNKDQPGLVAQLLVQSAAMRRVVAGVAGAKLQNHHTVGLAFEDAILATNGVYKPWETGVLSHISAFNVQSATSAASQTGDVGRPRAAFEAFAQLQAMLEGAVLQQIQDSWEPVSTPGVFALANRGGAKFIDVPANGFGSVVPQLSNYSQARLNRLAAISSAGFGLILPQNGKTGCFAFSGGTVCNNGGAEYAYSANAVGLLLNETRKGGADIPGDTPEQVIANLIRQAGQSSHNANGLSVVAGELSLAPSADLVSGVGDFPASLPLNRYYIGAMNGVGYPKPDADVFARLGWGLGWVHNFDISARLDNNALPTLAPAAAPDAAAVVAVAQVLLDLNQSPSFGGRLSSSFAAYWLTKQFVGNVVVVSRPPGRETFIRRADGAYRAAGSAAVLEVTGAKSGPRLFGQTLIFDYKNMALRYKLTDGSILDFSWTYSVSDFEVARPVFKPNIWSFSNGLKVTFSYDYLTDYVEGTGRAYVLKKVENNLGRSLLFNTDRNAVGGMDVGYSLEQGWPIQSISDENGRAISVSEYGTRITDVMGGITQYHYCGPECRYLLSSVSSPGGANTVIGYDDQFKVSSVTDGAGHATGYYNGFLGGEMLRRLVVVDPTENQTVQVLNDHNGSVRIVDPLGRVTQRAYDAAHRLILTVNPEGDSEARTYDVRSNLLSVTRHAKPGSGLADVTISTAYAEGPTVWSCANMTTCNKPISVTDARGAVTNYAWNSAGNLTQVLKPADANGQRPQTDFGYASFGAGFSLLTAKTEKLTASQSTITTYGYNSGNKYVLASSTVDAGGLNLTTSYAFDAIGNLTAVDGPRTDVADITNYSWDINRRLLTTISPMVNGARRAVRNTYDADGLLIYADIGLTQPDGSNFNVQGRTTNLYDAVGNKVRTTLPTGEVAEYAYDADDRLKCTAVRMGPSLGDACAVLNTAGGYDRITQTVYDAAGQTLQTLQGVGSPDVRTYATYTYSANGKQTSVQDANHNLTTLVYDGFDRLTKQVFPTKARDTGASNPNDYEAYGYDANGNRTSLIKRDGKRFTYDYDALNREIAKISPDGPQANVYTGYDLAGRKLYALYASIGGSGITYSYDSAGRMTSETTFGRSMSFQYDQASNRTRITWPDTNYGGYVYDAMNRVTLAQFGNPWAALGYDGLGRRSSIGRTTGAGTSYAYDLSDRLTGLSHDPAGMANDVTWSFAYNPASQVLSRTTSNSLYVWTGHPTGTKNTTADGLNRDADIAAVAGGYDANGNLTFDGTRTFTYDAENRLTSVSGMAGQPAMTLSYDPNGRLWQASAGGSVTQFVYDGDRLTAEYDGSGNILRRYLHGPGVDEPLIWYEGAGANDPRYLHADRQGSIVAWSDASGVAQQTYTYGPYGETQTWTGSRFRYTGQTALPEAQLYYYKARFYDPVMGRFLQTDPVGYEDDLDLYAYTGNDPVNHGDPSGHQSYPACPECLKPRTSDAHGTTIVGLAAGASGGIPKTPISGNVQVSAGVAFNKGEVRGFASGSANVGVAKSGGDSVLAGALIGHHNGDPIDTAGGMDHAGAAGGDGLAVSVEKVFGTSADGTRQVTGTVITVGPGAGLSGGITHSETVVTATAAEFVANVKAEIHGAWQGFMRQMAPQACASTCPGF